MHDAAVFAGVRRWFANVRMDDEERRSDSVTLQVVAAMVVGLCICNVVLRLMHPPAVLLLDRVVGNFLLYSQIVGFALVIVLLRKGRFRAAVLWAFLSPSLCLSVVVAVLGVEFSAPTFRFYALPLAIGALLLGPRPLWFGFFALCAGILIGAARDNLLLGGEGPRAAHLTGVAHD